MMKMRKYFGGVVVFALALALFVPNTMASSADKAKPLDAASAVAHPPAQAHAMPTPSATPTPGKSASLGALIGWHHVVVRNAAGEVVAIRDFHNLVTTAGKNYLLGAGLAGSPSAITTWYVSMLAEASHQAVSSCSGTALVVPSSVSTTTGQNVTIYGATTVATTITTSASSTSQTVGSCPSSATVVSFGPTLAAADTMSSHSGWTEVSSANITNSVRATWTPGSVSAGSVNNSGSVAVYTMAGSIGTVYLHGLFLTSNNTLGGTTGTLYSEAEFSGGALAVGASYTVNDTYTLSLTRLEERLQQFVDYLYDAAA